MKLITRKILAASALERWKRPYGGSKLVMAKLVALGTSPDPDEVDNVIGNTYWTKPPKCTECHADNVSVMEIDVDDTAAMLCLDCLRKAVELLEKES